MSIALLVQECLAKLKLFQQHSEQYEQGQDDSTIEDELGRFKIWCGNLSAHRPFGGRSLEHRLRDSPNLRDEVLRLLSDLRNALQRLESPEAPFELVSIPTEGDDDNDDDDDDDDDSLDFEYDDLAIQPVHPLQNVHDVINVLYRFSITLRNPAGHRRILEGASSISSVFLPYDLERVSMKYPKAQSHLTERLGRAMATRRQYFKYRQDHHAKMADGLGPEVLNEQQSNKDQLSTIATSVRPVATAQVIDYADETESVYSATSFAPTESESGRLRPPPLPLEGVNGDPFQCPICYSIQNISTDEAWRRHVFEDVQPYSCTVSECSSKHALFSRRRDWQRHQVKMHNNIWTCPLGCAASHSSRNNLEQHLVDEHSHSRDDPALPNILEASAKPNQQKENLECPLCQKAGLPVNAWFKHVGKHMEQLALSSLPSSVLAEDSDSDDEEADSPQRLRTSASGESDKPDVKAVDSDDAASNPTIAQEIPADWIFALRTEVKERGGYDKVNESGSWSDVAGKVGNPRKPQGTTVDLPGFVKSYYEHKLLTAESARVEGSLETRQDQTPPYVDAVSESLDAALATVSLSSNRNGELNGSADGEAVIAEDTDALILNQRPASSHLHDEESDSTTLAKQDLNDNNDRNASAQDQSAQDVVGLEKGKAPGEEATVFITENTDTPVPPPASRAFHYECPEPGCGLEFTHPMACHEHRVASHGYGPNCVFKCDMPLCSYTSNHGDKIMEHCWRKHQQDGSRAQFTTLRIPLDGPEVPSARGLNPSQASLTRPDSTASDPASGEETIESRVARIKHRLDVLRDGYELDFADQTKEPLSSDAATLGTTEMQSPEQRPGGTPSKPESSGTVIKMIDEPFAVRMRGSKSRDYESLNPVSNAGSEQQHRSAFSESSPGQSDQQIDPRELGSRDSLEDDHQPLHPSSGLSFLRGMSSEGTSQESPMTESQPAASEPSAQTGTSVPANPGRTLQERIESTERRETGNQNLRGMTMDMELPNERATAGAPRRRRATLRSSDLSEQAQPQGEGSGALPNEQLTMDAQRKEARDREYDEELAGGLRSKEEWGKERGRLAESMDASQADEEARALSPVPRKIRLPPYGRSPAGGEEAEVAVHSSGKPADSSEQPTLWGEWVRKEVEEPQEKKEAVKNSQAEQLANDEEKDEAERKFQAEMRRRLTAMGYTEATIDVLVDEEKAKKFREEQVAAKNTATPDKPGIRQARAPVYPKIHRNYLALETLTYYDLPWQYDKVDPDYIIILMDMDRRDTDILFEHTRRLRSKEPVKQGTSENSPTIEAEPAEDSYRVKLEEAERARQAYEEAKRELDAELERRNHTSGHSSREQHGQSDSTEPPIRFTDALGHKFNFPWRLCKTWKGMEILINQAFQYIDSSVSEHVKEGHYDLCGPNGEIILPQVWESMVRPDYSITMHLWPIADEDALNNLNARVISLSDKPDSSRQSRATRIGKSKLQSKSKDSKNSSSFARWMSGSQSGSVPRKKG